MPNATQVPIVDGTGAPQTVSTIDALLAVVATQSTLAGVLTALQAAIPAGANTIGQVNGNGAAVEVVPAVTAGAYVAGNVIGGIMTFANALPASFNGILQSITLKFKATVQ